MLDLARGLDSANASLLQFSAAGGQDSGRRGWACVNAAMFLETVAERLVKLVKCITGTSITRDGTDLAFVVASAGRAVLESGAAALAKEQAPS